MAIYVHTSLFAAWQPPFRWAPSDLFSAIGSVLTKKHTLWLSALPKTVVQVFILF